jgi:hypothetical protein
MHWRLRLKQIFRIAILFVFTCAALAAFSNFAQAQKIDLAFGVGTLLAPSASSASGDHNPVSLSGGTYPGFSGDVLFWHNVGIGGEIFWRATQNQNYQGNLGLNDRPVFFDFDAVYAPKIANHAYLELGAGIGALDTRFYCANCGNGYNTNYTSDKHFLGDFGGGIKFYPKGGFFIRPEAKLYLVENNIFFSSARFARVGASIGYTFGTHH